MVWIANLLDLDPSAIAPIAVTMAALAPAVLLAFFPLPAVRHDAELQGGFVAGLAGDFPAIAFLVAYDGRGCGCGAQGESCAESQRYRDKLHGFLHVLA